MARASARRFARLLCVTVASGLVLSGCDWTMFRYGPARTGFDPTESRIGTANVDGLQQRWLGGTAAFDSILASPAVANGAAYVTSNRTLYAFKAGAGSAARCSGSPKVCVPLWTATTGGFIGASPAVVNGVAYIGSSDGKLYAFDATGNTNCSGNPKTCTALWTAPTGGLDSSPAVSGGIVYVGSGDRLYALDAAGNTNCSGNPKTCTPLWSARTGGTVLSSPAVVNRAAYVGSSDGKLYAFDATGNTNCSGSPKTCTPLWTAATGDMITTQSPAVAHGVVYIASFDHKLYAFDAAGSTNCSGNPRTCTPLWTATPGGGTGGFRSPAVANGVVYIGAVGQLLAYDALGSTNCSGNPRTCTPLWSASRDGLNPIVANGIVYLGSTDGNLYAYGLP